MNKFTCNKLAKVAEVLDKSEIPTEDRLILVPAEINRKNYKGRGRPRFEDYVIRKDFREAFNLK